MQATSIRPVLSIRQTHTRRIPPPNVFQVRFNHTTSNGRSNSSSQQTPEVKLRSPNVTPEIDANEPQERSSTVAPEVFKLEPTFGYAEPKNTSSGKSTSTSASAKLFADAAHEEAEEKAKMSQRLSVLEQQYPNWDGDESIKDAVLRMLVDKYKPLRTGTIQTAEEKIKLHPPKLAPAFGSHEIPISTPPQPVKLVPTTGSWATESLLPAKENHQPWHTEFKAPSMDNGSVKLAQMPPPPVTKKTTTQPMDDRARRLAREEKKRTQKVGRLSQAKESTLDYRLGIKGHQMQHQMASGMPNPTSIKGWNSLIEDKIENARKAGVFNSIKGRGKPLERTTDEYNPFIAREEFLMNRIVQRNNAAPPWIEIQRELDTAVATFREILRQAWIRRTIRVLVMEHPAPILAKLTLDDIQRHRDAEWIAKEKSYHTTAVDKLNALVRNYNGMAPYAVRRAYYTREAEVEKLYEECAPAILHALAERVPESPELPLGSSSGGSMSGPLGGGKLGKVVVFRFLDWLRLLFRRLFGIKET
ncbi:hypothetical protein BDN70DRAFT_805663 [Pholiota conissans]|uniref:DnaJ homologue subfamily C member 28 conserved domain-containing protein n=1 Tax=Pholiota conissans TaxID=109636 RepID=A0A9P5Z506_9AGAR|nr:hypothetical protein BDN70DRAFT_805663 [Pholiota conissans]